MSELTLALLWYFVIGMCVVFYVVLDGFDLGVGILHFLHAKMKKGAFFSMLLALYGMATRFGLLLSEELSLQDFQKFMQPFSLVFIIYVWFYSQG